MNEKGGRCPPFFTGFYAPEVCTMIEKIQKGLLNVADWICIIAQVVIVVVLIIVVIGRYFFNYTPSWTEETALFMLTWIGLFSSSIAEYYGTHVRVSVIDNVFPPVVLRAFGIIRYFLKLGFFSFFTYYAFRIFLTTRQRFGALPLSYKWQVLPAICTGLFSLIFLLLSAKKVFTDKHEHDVEKDLEILKDE